MSKQKDLPKRPEGMMHRSQSGAIERIRKDGDDDNVHRYEFKASSDQAVEMWRGAYEILDHSEGAVRMDWLKSGNAPVLGMHNRYDQVGVIESARLEGSHIYVTVRVAPSQTDLIADLEAGIVRNVSIGYRVHDEVLESRETDDNGNTTRTTWKVTDWEPAEVSFVSIPADRTVGLGRSAEESEAMKTRVKFLESKLGEDRDEPASNKNTRSDNTMSEPNKDTPTIEVVKADKQREDAVSAERKRTASIQAVANRAREDGLGDFSNEAAEHIKEGKSLQEFQRHVLENFNKTPVPSTSDLGLTNKEQQRYSIANVVDGIRNGNLDKVAEFELEVSTALQDQLGRSQERVAIPVDMLLRNYVPKDERLRDMIGVSITGSGNSNTASNIVATDLLPHLFVESLREESDILSMINMIGGLTGDVEIPIELLNPTFQWVGENVAPAEAGYGLDKFKLEFKSIGTAIPFTRQARKQTTPQIEGLLMNSIRKGLAIALAKAVISGDGSAQPRGVLNTPGIGAVTTGGTLDRTKFRTLRKTLGDANVDLSRAKGITSSNGEFLITDTLLDAGSGKFLGEVTEGNRLRTIIGEFCTTNVCPASTSIFGDWSAFFMGLWGGVEVDRDTATGADKGATYLRFWQDADGIAPRGAEFAAITDHTV